MASATTCNFRPKELTKNEPDFVTVVSVGNNQQASTTADNFVTVLSIGAIDKNHSQNDTPPTTVINNSDIHPEEEVEVFRLPGEPLGFGLKFEGGAKNAEKVKRLFVQSCAEQSPASRAKCSWGTIGEGDEVLSIDGVPVTHMSRLDCVRRLKESQLVIKLLVRCRGALRPEVVSAELKSPAKNIVKCEKKIPPELPSVPPPVPPRKLRHARGSGDGEANPIPAKKTWNGSPVSSGSSSQNDSPQSKLSFQIVGSPRNAAKTTCEDSSLMKSSQSSPNICSKKSPNERSPELTKSKQEPSEAMVYLDARSQDGSSTHGSTSDDTGSSMSTVVDRFSLSDRFSTVSTTSTTSGGAAEQSGCSDRTIEEITDETFDSRDVTRLPTLEHLEKDFLTNPSEYLLKRLASSEAATHVELRGDAGAVVEKITAVVAPNTIIIEETMTLQPPLSFQDAPLSYGHETRPGLVYTADLAADSTTHFRPIRDEASIVECVNGATANSYRPTYEPVVSPVAPKLPIRNHVNRIPVNQQKDSAAIVPETIDNETHHSREVPMPRESIDRVAPILPPKPLPRKDIKLKRKRPPPPPPPPPRREPPPPVPVRTQPELIAGSPLANVQAIVEEAPDVSEHENPEEKSLSSTNTANTRSLEVDDNEGILLTDSDNRHTPSFDSPSKKEQDAAPLTNKVLEIIEMKKNKAFKDSTDQTSPSKVNDDENISSNTSPGKNGISVVPAPREKRKSFEKKRDDTVSTELEDSSESNSSEIWQEAKEHQDSSDNISINVQTGNGFDLLDGAARDDPAIGKDGFRSKCGKESNVQEDDDDDDETYRSLDEMKEDFKSTESNGTLSESSEDDDERHGICGENPEMERDSTSDDSEDNGDDYYWQSNLATIGEEEENSSLEYTNANKDVNKCEDKSLCGDRVEMKNERTRGCTVEITETMKNGTIGDVTKPECVRRISNETANSLDNKLDTQVNGRMENCGGDQRLPPDGDEFPATYQEFSACTSEQYQYVGTSARLTPRISSSNNNITNNNNNNNNIVKSSSENLVRNEKDENSSSTILTTSSTSSTKYTKSFIEKISNESTKTLRVESTTKKISTNDNNDVISSFRESREKSSSYVQTTNNKPPQSENHSSSQYITNSLKREIIQKPEVPGRHEFTEESKRSNSSYSNNSKPKICDVPVVVTEKTLDIPNYYSKETKPSEKIGREVENCYDKRDGTREPKNCDKNEPEYPESPPPPLPLTGPPKVEASGSSIGRTVDKIPEATHNRKYSLTSDLRRQDDKSEKSVRDKIAMFSSQSSLESPLFPSQASVASPIATVTTTITSSARKLAKYKSSDDVFNDEKMSDKREYGNMIERTQSFVDLTDSAKYTFEDQTIKDNGQRPPSLPKTLPPDKTDFSSAKNPPKATIINSENSPIPYVSKSSNQQISNFDFIDVPIKPIATLKPATSLRSTHNDVYPVGSEQKNVFPTEINCNSLRSSQPNLTRATSFSGESSFVNDFSQSVNSTISNNGQISRTNSLASTFKRNNEDMRRQSLNQLIEQRRKGISKLRGLVIPEKNSLPVDKPIIDLPEIKSRDSILLHQLPKSSIQDKWGSQSSLTSNASTTSLPMKATTSFKMPAPQIMSKYSPAFKRKSLAVYGTSTSNSSMSNTPTSTARGSPVQGYSGTSVDPPKSLESICSPTRSDYSFEFASSTSVSPETMRNRSRPLQRKIRGDYDDSDNDSAVSSSQSSISRGFSPPTSPVPSERSSLSSERSYHTSLIMDVPARHYLSKETPIRQERMQHLARPILYNERTYSNSERSSSGSSSCGSPNARSPLPEVNPRNSHIPQRQALKRSSSTETNCSSGSSSTLTSGSQASAESLSRRVLKPQSVEAINRKNILASARCRSGRDLNGSPLIQRKFSTDEELPISSLAQDNGTGYNGTSGFIDRKDVKIAYIEVTEAFDEQRQQNQPSMSPQTIKATETSLTNQEDDSTNSNLMEASNGLKMWVRSEAKSLMTETPRPRLEHTKKHAPSLDGPPVARSRALNNTSNTIPSGLTENWTKGVELEISNEKVEPCRVQRSSSLTNPKETIVDSINEDLLTTLTTKSRSRAPINLEDRSFGRSSRQMSLEDILVGKKSDEKVFSQSEYSGDSSIANGQSITSPQIKFPPATLPRSINGRPSLGETNWTSEDKSFVSKIPMPEKLSRSIDGVDDSTRFNANSRISKIPTQRTLGRRSTSVTDMKKALERTDSINGATIVPNNHSSIGSHHRFPSLDSSVEQTTRSTVHEPEKFNGEQFGSISSLASSTSLISQQELAQLVEDANALEDSRGNHEVIVVLLHKENSHGSVGITLAGGVDCEAKEITVHRVLGHSIADKDGRVQRGDRILSINGRSTKGLSHRESLAVLKQPRSEIVLVVSRSRLDDGPRLRSRTESVETIVEGSEMCGTFDETAWGPTTRVTIFKDGAGLGFSLAGGRDSPLGDRPLVIKKIFTGGAAEKTASLTAGDQVIEVNGVDVTRMTRIEAWSLMKKLSDGEATLLVRHPATKSS